MEEKFTAVYVMVRQSELTPEDGGSYDIPLEKQKQACLRFLRKVDGNDAGKKVEIYTSRGKLLIDVERDLVDRLVIAGPDRLGSSGVEIDGILFELKMRNVEILTVSD
ncbi:MAG: recombinase family protein [Desulfobacteraceae bacterium]|nr:recombinase family protein [Desulfobacteraceae bacterium]